MQLSTRAERTAGPPAPSADLAPVRIQRCGEAGCPCVEEESAIQRDGIGPAPTAAPTVRGAVRDVLASPGRPLEPRTAASLGRRLGHDFADVRVHHDDAAARGAAALRARAWTAGEHVVFANGAYAPETPTGRALLAHELAHVVQQRGSRAQGFSVDSDPTAELEAKRVQESVTRDATAALAPSSGPPAPPPAPAPAPIVSAPISVDAIDIVSSSTGAASGFPVVTTGDLNVPGPWNHATNGGVGNVHQIHFHLDQGDSAELSPRRELQRSAWRAGVEEKNPTDLPLPGVPGVMLPGGFHGVVVGPDGPPAHEVRRPSDDTIVIADAPGVDALAASQFPYAYKSHFAITVSRSGVDIALARYDVEIEKHSDTDVPNTRNSVISVTKEDLVRGRSLG